MKGLMAPEVGCKVMSDMGTCWFSNESIPRVLSIGGESPRDRYIPGLSLLSLDVYLNVFRLLMQVSTL